jgi:hypothetical protein
MSKWGAAAAAAVACAHELKAPSWQAGYSQPTPLRLYCVKKTSTPASALLVGRSGRWWCTHLCVCEKMTKSYKTPVPVPVLYLYLYCACTVPVLYLYCTCTGIMK